MYFVARIDHIQKKETDYRDHAFPDPDDDMLTEPGRGLTRLPNQQLSTLTSESRFADSCLIHSFGIYFNVGILLRELCLFLQLLTASPPKIMTSHHNSNLTSKQLTITYLLAFWIGDKRTWRAARTSFSGNRAYGQWTTARFRIASKLFPILILKWSSQVKTS